MENQGWEIFISLVINSWQEVEIKMEKNILIRLREFQGKKGPGMNTVEKSFKFENYYKLFFYFYRHSFFLLLEMDGRFEWVCPVNFEDNLLDPF